MEGGSPSPKATVGAEADVPKASPEGRPQVPAKPRVPSRPQELASPPASRPTPAPRKASESTAPMPPTPRPRSSLQQENLVEQGGGSGLVNGERGSRWGWGLPGVCLAFKRTCAREYPWGTLSVPVCGRYAGDGCGTEVINSCSKLLPRSL